MSLVRGLTEIGGKAVKKTAPFYSAVDEALANLKRPKGTGAEFLTEVMKTKGVKKAEIADRKLEEAFKSKGKMTKEEAQQILKENPPPKLQEREYNEKMVREEEDIKEELAQQMYGRSYDDLSHRERRPVFDEAQRIMGEENGPQYGDYKTPGGENYREILLKLPQAKSEREIADENLKKFTDRVTARVGRTGWDFDAMTPEELVEYEILNKASMSASQTRPSSYRSRHWKEDPNVLAHMRVQDRTGPNGEKILHVEEIQSDWHQEGRKKGYKPEDYVEQSNKLEDEFSQLGERRFLLLKQAEAMPTHGPEFTNLIDEANSITPKLMRLQEQRDKMRDVINYGVPDAPFKKNWHELAMKRLLNYAADNGYDSIAITPGAEQAKRYDISKQISKVQYDPNEQTLYAYDKNGREVISERGVEPHQLADYIGKEPAEKLRLEVDNATSALNEYDVVRDPESGKYGLYLYGEPSYDYGGEQLLFDSKSEARDHLRSMIDDGISSNLPTISGLDLTVGGEGMKGFYDKILPDYLNNFGKPYGAQVGKIPVQTGTEMSRGASGSDMIPTHQPVYLDMHNFPITPEMREQIKQKGLPLYQQIGIPTAGAGAASQALQPEEEQGLSGGGMVNSAIKQAHLAKLAKMRQEMAPRAEAVKNLIAKDANSYLRDVVPNSLTNPEIEAEIARMAARAKAAGQQEGVLPKAQRDANLSKMLEQSAIKDRLFHGTTSDVPRFDPNMAGKKTGNLTSALGTFLSDNPAESSRYAEQWGTEGGNVMPVFAQLKNPYQMPYSEYNNLAMGAWNRRTKDPDYDPKQIVKFGDVEAQKRAAEALKKHEAEALQDVINRRNELIDQGHDSVVVNIGGNREIIVFDPNKIKSATGNRGTYDINDPDVNKAMGGSVKRQVKKADGGAINYNTAPDMSDGERIIQGAPFKHGGKVNMTANRDAMFMELSNKKLKRK